MRNDASAGMQRFGNEKLGSDVALAYVFFECCSDRIVIVSVHGGAEAASYVQNPTASIERASKALLLAA